MSQGITTTVIGSYPQPAWLVDHEALKAEVVPRVRAPKIWRIEGEFLEQAQNDATILAIRDQERAGIDTITDGEIRRESYSNLFATSLDGIDLNNPHILQREGFTVPVPRVVAPIQRTHAVELDDFLFLKANTSCATKVTLPGPFTLSQQAYDEYYGDGEALAMAYADVVNAEAQELQRAGADVIQLDEPWLRNDPDAANRYAVKAIDRALRGLSTTTAIHLCFGYGFIVSPQKPKVYDFLEQLSDCCVDQISIEAAQPHLDLGVLRNLPGQTIVLGVLDLSSNEVESIATIVARIRRALDFVEPHRLVAAPDCGMKYLTRDAAFAKLSRLSAAVRELNHAT